MSEEQKFEEHKSGLYSWSDHDRWIVRKNEVTKSQNIVGRIFGDAQCWAFQIARRPWDYPQIGRAHV